jgi:hypothetical protein
VENQSLRSVSIVKKGLIYLVFAVEQFLLFRILNGFILNQKYFSLSTDFGIPFGAILIPTLWTVALISQTIEKRWEILIAPSILLFSSLIFLIKFKPEEVLIGSAIASLYFLYKFQISKSLGDALIKIKIRFSGKSCVKGFLLSISFLTAFSVFLTSENISSVNIGKWASEMMEEPVEEAVQKELEKQDPGNITSLNLESIKNSNPQISAVLNSFGIEELPADISLPESNSENITGVIKNSISSQINSAVEPYKKYFSPILAVLVFGLMQIYGAIIYFLYFQTISAIFFILRKTNFIKVENIPTEKEILRY